LIELIVGLDPKVTSLIANSIWYRTGLSVKTEFSNVNKSYFNAEVTALDFSDPGAPAVINAWVNKNTNGRIPNIIDSISPEIVMYLIDAIYFKGTWTTQFDPKHTHDDAFQLIDGSSKPVRMMMLKDTMQYWENDDFQAVDLPYGNGLFSMSIVLPKRGTQVDEIVADFTGENWGQWVGAFRDKHGTLELPRFKLAYELQMNSVLQALGMGVAFEACCADFSGIADVSPERLFISEVKHKAFVEVNEEGTEAAAVTSVAIGKTSVGDSFSMKVDRPFLFVIREHHSNAIIFAGKIMAP
jgi:serine protease inhibitor